MKAAWLVYQRLLSIVLEKGSVSLRSFFLFPFLPLLLVVSLPVQFLLRVRGVRPSVREDRFPPLAHRGPGSNLHVLAVTTPNIEDGSVTKKARAHNEIFMPKGPEYNTP